MDTTERERILSRIIEIEIEDIVSLHSSKDDWYIEDILRNGFAGYINSTDEQLLEYLETLENNQK
jgi:hypothetical protein